MVYNNMCMLSRRLLVMLHIKKEKDASKTFSFKVYFKIKLKLWYMYIKFIYTLYETSKNYAYICFL